MQSKIGYLLSRPLPTPTTDTATDCIMNIITPLPDTCFGQLETLDIQSEKDDEYSEYLATYGRNCTVFKDRPYSTQLPWKPYRVPDPQPLPKIRVQDALGFRVAIVDGMVEQWSHHIEAHREALPIRSLANVYFVACRMSRR